ncbi:hypothetical protein SAMN05660337_2001 [Maridesulfovibrio ferrireducens]|uniref:Uncharacterized protein n=1 Tax=Maridesulfovibrio ferrireducens TaxID=246191 RepID=A0A1G9H479_9BACT|nr:hypothetical protein [Maridesulfovibrio ferrireducens]SDL07766.1 hypothetical protein SAMN05660337_2001 [Maridesulfovibrio ferrireducens]
MMDIFLAFIIGSLGKFCGYFFFFHEKVDYFIIIPLSCVAVCMTAKRHYLSYPTAALGFASHEYLFSSVGISMGLIYQQYTFISFLGSFTIYLILLWLIHFSLILGTRGVAFIQSHVKNR